MDTYDVLDETIISLPRIKGKVKIEVLGGWDGPMWRASREGPWGWVKIPAMTRSECRQFPLTIAKAAQQFLDNYTAKGVR